MVVFFAVAGTRNSIRKEDRSKTNGEIRRKRRGRRRRGRAEKQEGKRERGKSGSRGKKKKKRDQRHRGGREAYKRYTSEQIKIVESPSIYGLAHRNCNHLTTTFISMRFSRNLFFLSLLLFFSTPTKYAIYPASEGVQAPITVIIIFPTSNHRTIFGIRTREGTRPAIFYRSDP